MEENETLTLAGAFHEVIKHFREFVYFRFSIYHVITSLWVLLSHAFRELDCVVYLYLFGAPSSGKSLLLKLFEILCFNPIYAVRMTNAATYRAIDERQGTFLFDESDILARRAGSFILAIYLNGYKKGGYILLCDKSSRGLIQLGCFCMKAFATTIWIANQALLSRCIILIMTKPDPEKQPKRFRLATDGKVLETLAKKIRVLFEK